MDLTFLAQADAATLKLELAKSALEAAKIALEEARVAYDETFAQADSLGIPRAKVKKLSEDRVAALIEAGMVSVVAKAPTEAKKPKKQAKSEIPADIPALEEPAASALQN